MHLQSIGKGVWVKKKNALRARPQGIHHQFTIVVLDQQHGRDSRIGNAQPAQKAQIRQVVARDQDHIGAIRLQEVVQSKRLQRDSGNLKIPPAFQGPRQELRLNGAGIGDQDLHCFGFDHRGCRGQFRGAHGIHAPIMP
jgi:hypothetical protein